jgi:hypothetical protein
MWRVRSGPHECLPGQSSFVGSHDVRAPSIRVDIVSRMLKPGDKAPDFTLLDQKGETFTLSKSIKQRKVWHLIYFYP